MGVGEMKTIGDWIHEVLQSGGDANTLSKVRGHVKDLCQSYPIFRE
jgi:glycine/serine hydroxymethyltransferase